MQEHEVLEVLKTTIEASKPKNVLFLIKDGFATGDLVKNMKKFENLKTLMSMHASMYTNLR